MIQGPCRLAAFVSLLLSSTAAISPSHAQGKQQFDGSSRPYVPPQAPKKAPLDMSSERQSWLMQRACGSNVSRWISRGGRIICTFTYVYPTEGYLFLEDKAFLIAPGNAVVDGRKIGAKCELVVTYTDANGFHPLLVCEFPDPDMKHQSIRILADGAKVAEFPVADRFQRYNLGPAFGRDIRLMRAVSLLEVVLNFHGKDVTLFKARLSDPTDGIAALKRAVDEEDDLVAAYSHPSSPKPKRRDCFLTEACCAEVGLSDDCFELAALRRYRDHVLAASPGGAAEIRLYYALAPVLLRALQREPHKRDLLRLYFTHILPCAMLAACGLNGAVHRRYVAMMVGLCERWAPEYLPVVRRISSDGDSRRGQRA